MTEPWLHALCALAAFFIPLGFAWFVVSRTARRHVRRRRRRDDPMR
jgi:hypothetical protein